MQKQQLEIDTRPCRSLDELSRELRRCRATAAAAAARAGVTVAALGTSPLAVHPEVVPTSRYQAMAAVFGLTASWTSPPLPQPSPPADLRRRRPAAYA